MQTFALFALSLVQELFVVVVVVFGLLVALSIMSGDLKLCRECVIVEFFKTSVLTGGTVLMSFFFFLIGFLHNLTNKMNVGE